MKWSVIVTAERVVEVEAETEDEALDRAAGGEGDIVSDWKIEDAGYAEPIGEP